MTCTHKNSYFSDRICKNRCMGCGIVWSNEEPAPEPVELPPGVDAMAPHKVDMAEIEERTASQVCKAEVEDVHTRKAAEHFGIPVDRVSVEQRKVGKQLNFMTDFNAGVDYNNPVIKAITSQEGVTNGK